MRSLRLLAILAFGLVACTGGGPEADATSDATSLDAGADASEVTTLVDVATDAGNDSTPIDALDSGVTDAIVPGDAAVCPILGTYQASLNGMTIYFRFGSAGQYVAAMSMAGLDTMPFNMGSYAYDASTRTLTFMQDSFCSDVGSYRLSFSGDCNTVTFAIVSDACPGRGAQTDGLLATRVP